MNYVKARYEGSKRSYCFAAEEDLKPGDEAISRHLKECQKTIKLNKENNYE